MKYMARPFKKILKENLLELLSLKFLLLPLAVAFIKSLDASIFFDEFWKRFFDIYTWIISFAIFFADAFLRATYWYARERKPSYIKKMQEQEERQAAKEAQKHQSVGADLVKDPKKGDNT
jgi:hypothetical protein